MNPLIVLFFTSMILEDYLFRDAKLFKYLLYSIGLYWISHLFIKKSTSHSPYRKLQMANFSQSYDPSVYCKLKFDLTKIKDFLARYESKTGKKVSVTLFMTKVVAETLGKYPECNMCLKFGSLYNKKSVDVSVLVDMGGKDLASLILRDIPNKSFGQLIDEMTPEVKSLREDTNQEFKKASSQLANIPSFVAGVMLELAGFFSNIGISIKPMGLEANKFGSVVITSLGSLKLADAMAPLCPFTYTCILMTICASKKKRILNKDGSFTDKEILPVNITLDHRFMDGILGAIMIKFMTNLCENPDQMKVL